jgi:DNA-directed RNA polymerase subunit K/omega
MGSFAFVVIARLRAAQLTRGCVPRVTGDHSTAVTAQREIAEGKVIPTWSLSGATPGTAPLERPR